MPLATDSSEVRPNNADGNLQKVTLLTITIDVRPNFEQTDVESNDEFWEMNGENKNKQNNVHHILVVVLFTVFSYILL